MNTRMVALGLLWTACSPRAVAPLDAGAVVDAGPLAAAGMIIDAGSGDAGPCSLCPHGTWCPRETCVPECARCLTDRDCADGGSCSVRGDCVFLERGCSGPDVESVRIGVVGAWILPDVMELDVATGRLGKTEARPSSDGGTELRDAGVVFIDAGAWRTARAWCPFPEVLAEECAFDVAVLHVEVTGGGQTNRFGYYAGASHLPELHPLIMDVFQQFNALIADAGNP